LTHGFAPTSNSIPEFNFIYEVEDYESLEPSDKTAIDLAIQYWKAVSVDERISQEMKKFLERDLPIKL